MSICLILPLEKFILTVQRGRYVLMLIFMIGWGFLSHLWRMDRIGFGHGMGEERLISWALFGGLKGVRAYCQRHSIERRDTVVII